INYSHGMIISNIRIAEYFLSLKDSGSAHEYVSSANAIAKDIKEYSYQLETLLLLSQTDKKQEGKHLREYIRLNDSINNEERKEREKFARIAFETDEISKEKELALAETEKIATRFWAMVS